MFYFHASSHGVCIQVMDMMHNIQMLGVELTEYELVVGRLLILDN